MAVELGGRITKDTESYNDYAIGITLPIQRSNVYFAQAFDTRTQVRSNLLNLLLTKRGERIMQPEFGSGLQEIIFDFNDDTLPEKIETAVENAISQWLPYVNVTNIDVEQTDYMKDTNKVYVHIDFTVNGTQELNSVTFTI